MNLSIEPLHACRFLALREALDSVAREKRFLAFTEAPPLEEAYAFYASVLSNQECMRIAILDGVVVGWCDILRGHGQARAHVGSLGIGVVAEARGQGVGSALLCAAIDVAWASGLTRIELAVREDNPRAKALYARRGFLAEGLLRRAFTVDGVYYDATAMALLRDH